MITLRPAAERGHFDHGWLDTRHTFSFGQYYDPRHMGFHALRVMNEDRLRPGAGFGEHGHDNMEIVTYVLAGVLEHRDNLGNGAVLRPGEFQRMSAGTGIRHSEFNPSHSEWAHFYQIWLLPGRKDIEPSYQQRAFPEAERSGRWRLVAAPDAADGSLAIVQDARIYLTLLAPGESVEHRLPAGRCGWLQVLRGAARWNDTPLAAGDGAAIDREPSIHVTADEPCEALLFDLA